MAPKPKRNYTGPGKNSFGKTWWGGEFLNAFTGIDFSNRLPRGVTYANNGSCSGIKITKNIVTASVQGSEYHPYRVQIAFKDFSSDEMKVRIQSLLESKGNLVVSKLLNNELPESLFAALAEANIPLFPKRWAEVNARCSCPDTAVPCKHIAAVIFKVGAEIDKNPFVCFEIHNCDVKALLPEGASAALPLANEGAASAGKPGRGGQEVVVNQVPVFEDLVSSDKDAGEEERAMVDGGIDQIDFTKMEDFISKIKTILKEKPLFFPKKDFRELLMAAYRHWAKIYSLTTGAAAGGGAAASSSSAASSGAGTTSRAGAQQERVPVRRTAANAASRAMKKRPSSASGVVGDRDSHAEVVKALKSVERVQIVLDCGNSFVKLLSDADSTDEEMEVDDDSSTILGMSSSSTILSGGALSSSANGVFASAEVLQARLAANSLPEENFDGVEQFTESATGGETNVDLSQHFPSLAELLDFLELDVPADERGSYCYDLQFLTLLISYADHLAKNNAFTPQVLFTTDFQKIKKTFVRWVPALLTPEMHALHDKIADACPRNFVLVQKTPGKDLHTFSSRREQVNAVVAAVLKTTIQGRAGTTSTDVIPPQVAKIGRTEPVLNLFFQFSAKPTTYFTDEKSSQYFSLKEIPKTIHIWLHRLFLAEKNYKIRLVVKNYSQLEKAKKKKTANTTNEKSVHDESENYFGVAVEVQILPKPANPPPKAAGAAASSSAAASSQQQTQHLRQKPQIINLKQFFQRKRGVTDEQKTDVLANLNILCEYLPGFENVLAELGKKITSSSQQAENEDEDDDRPAANADVLQFHYTQFSEIFLNVFPVLESLNIAVVLPRALRRRAARPRLSLKVRDRAEQNASSSGAASSSAGDGSKKKKGFMGLSDMCAFEWTVAIGDREIPAEEFKKLAKNSEGTE